MKSKLPARVLPSHLRASVSCDALRDRRCLRVDGEPKRWYLARHDAKANARKHQTVYPCPSGTGYHIGS